MRIIAGHLRGRSLATIGKGDPAAHLRPTTDRVRESLFNTLTGGRFGDPIIDAVVLDLFAGTGTLAFEAISRGAQSATLVDNGRVASQLIRENIRKLDLEDTCTLLGCNALRLPKNTGEPANLIFLDAPYGKGYFSKAIGSAQVGNWIAEDALIVVEDNQTVEPAAGTSFIETRKMGDTIISFLRA